MFFVMWFLCMLVIYCWEDLDKFDRKAKHDGFKNTYSFEKDGRAYTFVSLLPR